jgi:ActR/RegA family two-component response regulator
MTSKKQRDKTTEHPKLLVLDDNEQVLTSIEKVSEANKLQIATAANVGDALNLIDTEPFDVLLSDLRMTADGDGLTAVSAMHKTNPNALTLVYTGYPELERALDVILLQSDEVLVPFEGTHEKVKKRQTIDIERIATILESDTSATVVDWLDRVERDGELTHVPLSREERAGHLPKMIMELAQRLRAPRKQRTKSRSEAAMLQGLIRHSQGYSIPMMVEESRILQVCIFQTLYNGMSSEEFGLLLLFKKTITDECDSQLRRTLASFARQAAKIAA